MEFPAGFLQSLMGGEHSSVLTQVLLLMIWFSSKKMTKEIKTMRETLTKVEIGHDLRISALEQWRMGFTNFKQGDVQ